MIDGITRRGWTALGCEVVVAVADARQIDLARRLVGSALADIDQACSRFRTDSELSIANARAGQEITLSPLLFDVMRAALDAAALTDGLVDPTVGAALVAAGYDRTFAAIAADGPAVFLEEQPVSGWREIQLDPIDHRLRTPPGVSLDLGAIGKAWAADWSAEMVAHAARCGVLVSCGGDVAVRGDPPGGGWPVEISELGPGRGHAETIILDTGGLATSGTTARQWRRGARSLHHVIDPRRGVPAPTPWLAVTATGLRCVDANTATTAAMVLGADAPAWLEERGIPARLVALDRSIVRTGGWPG